jgi:FTR1 family protein
MQERVSFYIWTALALAVAVTAVVLGWHARGGTTDPTALPPGHRLSHTTVVINSAILVFREGLETILVLAAVTASFLGANRVYRRPVALGGGSALLAGIATWFGVVWLIGRFHGGEFDVQAATGLPSLLVLLLVMNWFFHKVYWTGWISSHHKRRRSLLASDPNTNMRRMLFGLAVLGFTSVYREGFEIVIFLQNLRQLYGSSLVLEGVAIGGLFTAAAGVLTFALHQRLPYKRLLIITGVMLLRRADRLRRRRGQRDAARALDRHHTGRRADDPRLDGNLVVAVQQLGDVHRPGNRPPDRAGLLRARPVPPRLAPSPPWTAGGPAARSTPRSVRRTSRWAAR